MNHTNLCQGLKEVKRKLKSKIYMKNTNFRIYTLQSLILIFQKKSH